MPTSTKAANAAALMRELAAAGKRLALYPEGHPAARLAANRPYEILTLIWERQEKVIISLADGKLIGDGAPLDDRNLLEGLGRAMVDGNLQSVAFTKKLQAEELEAFLGHLNIKQEERDLIGFLKERQISGIEIDKWHYELVGHDEKVVSADQVIEGVAGDSSLRMTLSDLVRKHPGAVVSLLSRKGQTSATSGNAALARLVCDYIGGATPTEARSTANPGTGQSEGTAEELAVGSGGAIQGYGSGVENNEAGPKAGSESDLPVTPALPDPGVVLKQLDDLNDEELVLLLVAGLRESVVDEDLKSDFNAAQALLSIKDLLERKEDPALLRSLRDALVAAGIVEQRYLDLVFNQEATTEQIACDEAERFLEIFKSGEPEVGQAADLAAWIERIEDKTYLEGFVSRLFDICAAADYELNSAQQGTLAHFLELVANSGESVVAAAYQQEIVRRLADPAIGLPEFRFVGRHLEHFYLSALRQQDYDTARQMLQAINQKAFGKQVHADGVAGHAWELRKRLSSAKAVELVITKLARNFSGCAHAAFQLLESFGGRDAALAFAGHLTHPERGIRLMMIRLLSAMGDEAVATMRTELESQQAGGRYAQLPEVPEMIWYKLRNIILILGNTGHPDAVELLEPLSDFRDQRVAEEVIVALEKLHWDDATRILAKMLSHPERRVHSRAVRSLAERNPKDVYPLVEDYFLRHPSERQYLLPLLTGIDSARAGAFLALVLLGESEAYRELGGKRDEALNEMIVKTFIDRRSSVTDNVLRRYVRDSSRSLFAQLRKPPSVKMAEKHLRAREKR
ncbi:MAG: HEAT repeat domain-containing protein [bacterium]